MKKLFIKGTDFELPVPLRPRGDVAYFDIEVSGKLDPDVFEQAAQLIELRSGKELCIAVALYRVIPEPGQGYMDFLANELGGGNLSNVFRLNDSFDDYEEEGKAWATSTLRRLAQKVRDQE